MKSPNLWKIITIQPKITKINRELLRVHDELKNMIEPRKLGFGQDLEFDSCMQHESSYGVVVVSFSSQTKGETP